mgnify:CR=1 FL=1
MQIRGNWLVVAVIATARVVRMDVDVTSWGEAAVWVIALVTAVFAGGIAFGGRRV